MTDNIDCYLQPINISLFSADDQLQYEPLHYLLTVSRLITERLLIVMPANQKTDI